MDNTSHRPLAKLLLIPDKLFRFMRLIVLCSSKSQEGFRSTGLRLCDERRFAERRSSRRFERLYHRIAERRSGSSRTQRAKRVDFFAR